MWALPRRSSVVIALAIFAVALVLVPLASRPHAPALAEASGVILAAMLASVLWNQRAASSRAIMRPAFVVTITALLLYGADVAMLVAAVGAVTGSLTAPSPGSVRSRLALDAAIQMIAAQAAGLAYRALGAAAGDIGWPWLAVPIAAAAIAYHLAQGALTDIVVPLVARRPVARTWPKTALQGSPLVLVGAGAAAGVAALIEHRMWELLPAAGGLLSFAYLAYADYVVRLDEHHRRQEVIGVLEQGVCVVDPGGRLTQWDAALERIFECPRARAVGRSLDAAVPFLARTEVPRALEGILSDGNPRTVSHVRASSAPDARILQVKLLAVSGGVALVWLDVTERTHAERELKQAAERLALAAEGANDGLWQWDLRTQAFYVTGQWRAMMGLPAAAGVTRPDEWLERVHPDDVADLKDALGAHLAGHTEVFRHEHRIRHEDGNYRRFLCRGLAVKGVGRRRDRIAGSLTDTTEQSLAQERLRSVGFLDPLTGLFNRAVFVEWLESRLADARSRRVSNWFAVLYLDLDRFKIVNDSLGHLVGDELLIAVSRRLESCLRQGDALARLGGDEFAILLNGLADDSQANGIAFRIQDALGAPFSIGGREVFTSASIGIAFGPAQYNNPDEIMRDADTAMYHAKSRGKARHEVFDEDMHARVRDRLSLENDLRRAITSREDFEVHYQPIVSLASGMCVGFESLIRWTRNGKPVSPATFIPIAEELGLIEPLGTWVLQEACHTFAGWQRRFPQAGLDCITVNVSSRQLIQHNFFRVVQQAIESSGLRPADLRVEITETALMDSPGEAAGVLRDLRDFGVKVYLDDFGTGYSSLSHLHKLPVDALKIDSSFVRSMLLPKRPAIVESILALARTLNTSVVAEGIESDVQARELERLGCTHAQGFLFSRPLSVQSVEELVMANRPLGPKAAADCQEFIA